MEMVEAETKRLEIGEGLKPTVTEEAKARMRSEAASLRKALANHGKTKDRIDKLTGQLEN